MLLITMSLISDMNIDNTLDIIKKNNPERRKSFRARHKCAQAKDRTTPKYWSCKMWSRTPVSKIVGEDKIKGVDGKACWKGYKYAGTENGKDKCVKISESLDNLKKNSIFANNDVIIEKLNEMQDMLDSITLNNPVKEPVVIPETKPAQPSPRRKRIWEAEPAHAPKPKMDY